MRTCFENFVNSFSNKRNSNYMYISEYQLTYIRDKTRIRWVGILVKISKTVFLALKIISVEEVYKTIIILKHYCVSVDISFRQRQVCVFLLCIW